MTFSRTAALVVAALVATGCSGGAKKGSDVGDTATRSCSPTCHGSETW